MSCAPVHAVEEAFRQKERFVESSPAQAAELPLPADLHVRDFDIWPTGPQALVLVKDAAGQHVLSWRIGAPQTDRILDLPADFDANAIAAHPAAERFFLVGSSKGKSEIWAVDQNKGKWTPRILFKSDLPLRRLTAGPRPYATGWKESDQAPALSYRLFFGRQEKGGAFSLRSITEDGKREYQVLGPKASYLKFRDEKGVILTDSDEQPAENFVESALPETFHPGGETMIWRDAKGCFKRLPYLDNNWGKASPVAGAPCGGSLTATPNGMALLHWRPDAPGVEVLSGQQAAVARQAENFQFVSTPSSTPDGRGIVGLVRNSGGEALIYAPIDMPLANVVNAWLFAQNADETAGFSKNSGLFRATKDDQLYKLYDTETYGCGHSVGALPMRPYLVTTDIFWELYGSAFEGVFIVQEKQRAMKAFWSFVEAARQSLKTAAPGSRWAQAFEAAAQSRDPAQATDPIAKHIASAEGVFEDFNYGELKPRGHYATSPEMASYFKAVHYLTALSQKIEGGAGPLNALPADVQKKALAWIAVYTPFIAPSRSPLVWKSAFAAPVFARHPGKTKQIFPLSWGVDNEILLSSVFHEDWPANEQIQDKRVRRITPSGLDLAAAFGSGYARALLTGDLQKYPNLGPALDALQARIRNGPKQTDLYGRWLDALGVQWAEDAKFPGLDNQDLWKTKRLQTGLASWATLRHATVLVNERAAAEGGEGGQFEPIALRPPRGYVEPDPKTLQAIAAMFDDLTNIVAQTQTMTGALPNDEQENPEPLQQGILRRLKATAEKTRAFAAMADKELRGQALSDAEYEDILYIGRVAEHDLLVFKSLANKDLALSTPEPMMKIADVADVADLANTKPKILEAAVGRPIEWYQIAPFFGRRIIVKGSVYSYYEFVSPRPLSDTDWRGEDASPSEAEQPANQKKKSALVDRQNRPAWIASYFSKEALACPVKTPF